jgi:serine/threonine protein kinase
MAPEILSKQSYGKAVDLWSFGIVLFALLGGYFPFDNESNDLQVLKATILKGEFHFNQEIWSNITIEAKDLIKTLLTVDPMKRITAEQALNHSWMKIEEAILEEKELNDSLEALRNFKTSFKGVANAMICAKRWLKKTKQRKSALLSLPVSPTSTTFISSPEIATQRQSSFFSSESGDSNTCNSLSVTANLNEPAAVRGKVSAVNKFRGVVFTVIFIERMKRAAEEKKKASDNQLFSSVCHSSSTEASFHMKVYNFIYCYFLCFLSRFLARKQSQ